MLSRDPNYWTKNREIPPFVWATMFLGFDLYPWQIDTLDAVGQRIPTALAAANESGKTSCVAVSLVLWFLWRYGDAGGKIVITSGSWLQLETQLMPAIRRQSSILPGWEFLITQAKRKGAKDPQLILFSTDNPGRAEGHHAVDAEKAPLLIIADEAKSIPDPIFTAFDRCGPQFLLLMSSPGDSSGRFFECFNKHRSLYWTRRVKSTECPHIQQSKRDRDLSLYGPNHPIYLSIHEAEFAGSHERVIIPKATLRDALEYPPPFSPGIKVGFCDFAAGGDENVLAIREGNRAWLHDAWREIDTIQATRQFIQAFMNTGLRPAQIQGDASGLGTVMIDALADANWRIGRTYNNAASGKPIYANADTEAWFEMEKLLRKKQIQLPDDPDLFEQLTSRRWEYGPKQVLRVESKETLSARGLPSPDRADAIIGAVIKSRSGIKQIKVAPRPTPHRLRPSSRGSRTIYG
jgi:phage terminase large subunit